MTGCLFTMNHPVVLPDGTMAVFLEETGAYVLFSEGGTLHLLDGGGWLPVPAASLTTGGGLLDRSPDGSELLYVDVDGEDPFGPMTSTLYRVRADAEAVPEAVWETEESIARAAWMEDGRILLLLLGEEEFGSLAWLSLEDGSLEILRRDVLSFVADRESGRIDALRIDQDGDLVAGFVERYHSDVPGGRDQTVFHLSEQTMEIYLVLPHDLLWDVSSDGRWIALSLFDPTIIEPESDQDVPSLYLVDTETDDVERVSHEGLAPAFSPDGRWMAYLVPIDEETPQVLLRDLASGSVREVPEGEGASSLLWVDSDLLGLVFEDDDDEATLLELSLATGEARELIHRVGVNAP